MIHRHFDIDTTIMLGMLETADSAFHRVSSRDMFNTHMQIVRSGPINGPPAIPNFTRQPGVQIRLGGQIRLGQIRHLSLGVGNQIREEYTRTRHGNGKALTCYSSVDQGHHQSSMY